MWPWLLLPASKVQLEEEVQSIRWFHLPRRTESFELVGPLLACCSLVHQAVFAVYSSDRATHRAACAALARFDRKNPSEPGCASEIRRPEAKQRSSIRVCGSSQWF